MENVDNATTDSGPRPAQRTQNVGESRNRNLDILKAYIQRQRALLDRIKHDVDRLQSSKPALVADPSKALGRILHVDNNDNLQIQRESLDTVIGGVEKISELVSEVHGVGEATITRDIDWNVFRGSDLTSLRSFQPRFRTSLIPASAHPSSALPLAPSTPSLSSSRSSLSSFVSLDCAFDKASVQDESIYQIHVREERAKMIDPALTIAAQFLASLPPDSDDECVKQARAREAREAKVAKAREVREARKAKLQNLKNCKATAAKPSKKNGHVRKSAHRRKSEASAAAAALRPRGYGGRFRKKEVDETLATAEVQNSVPSTSNSVPTLSASISSISVPDLSSSTHQATFASTTSSTNSLVDESLGLENGRPQRTRKPSIRFGSAALSISSSRSTRSGSNASARRPPKDRQHSFSSMVPSNSQRGRLTIRIPARVPARTTAQDASEYRDGQISASTSTTTAVSAMESGRTSRLSSAGNSIHGLDGKQYGPLGWSTTEEHRTPGPLSVAFSGSISDVKQEEEEHENGIDLDNWSALEERNDRFRRESEYGISETPHYLTKGSMPKPDAMDLSADDDSAGESDSNDSFVCEALPTLPSSSTSDSSSRPTGITGGTNGNANGKAASVSGRIPSRRGDPSSKTFNVAWSDEEQRLLDMLLERYPDGTKNRWANISRAMGGKRTPRQVASRVQKYFAKMKKWGIDVT